MNVDELKDEAFQILESQEQYLRRDDTAVFLYNLYDEMIYKIAEEIGNIEGKYCVDVINELGREYYGEAM